MSMNFFETVRTRQSIRKFRATPVDEAQLQQILAATNQAPSAGNLQAYQIIIVRDPLVKAKLDAASGNQGSVAQAPVVLVFCTDPSRSAMQYGARGEQLYCIQDATIACAYAQLAATALGLASVWIGGLSPGLEPETIKEVLHLEEDLWPIALLPLGYPAEQPVRRARRPLREFVREL